VIGDAAVSAGLIAAPMLIVVAMSAITSFVIPKIYQSVAFLRFIFMLVAGLFGFYGIALGFCVMLVNICSQNPFGIPLSSPFSPLFPSAFRDTVLRQNWKKLSVRRFDINTMEK
jgi:spore germination protein KA